MAVIVLLNRLIATGGFHVRCTARQHCKDFTAWYAVHPLLELLLVT